jgi:hypothetical protein
MISRYVSFARCALLRFARSAQNGENKKVFRVSERITQARCAQVAKARSAPG